MHSVRSRKEVFIRLEEALLVLDSEVTEGFLEETAVRRQVESLGRVWTPLAG